MKHRPLQADEAGESLLDGLPCVHAATITRANVKGLTRIGVVDRHGVFPLWRFYRMRVTVFIGPHVKRIRRSNGARLTKVLWGPEEILRSLGLPLDDTLAGAPSGRHPGWGSLRITLLLVLLQGDITSTRD